MDRLGLAHVLGTLVVSTLIGALPACLGDEPAGGADGELAAVEGEVAAPLVGRWRFVYDDAIRARVESQLAASVPPAELAAARRAAEAEAAASIIELTDEGQFFSWVEGELHAESAYDAVAIAPDRYRVGREVKGGGRETTTVTLRGPDTLVIDDPRKGPLTFRRTTD